jgi:sulfopyruvate decarboxylase TPP-binding subunit
MCRVVYAYHLPIILIVTFKSTQKESIKTQ